jgi:hypothetical protein
VFCNIFYLLARDSALTQSNKLILHKSLIRSILTYAAPVCNSTYSSNYQKLHFKCLRDIRNHPRRTLHFPQALHSTHSSLPRYRLPLTAKFFAHCPSHAHPRVQQRVSHFLLATIPLIGRQSCAQINKKTVIVKTVVKNTNTMPDMADHKPEIPYNK